MGSSRSSAATKFGASLSYVRPCLKKRKHLQKSRGIVGTALEVEHCPEGLQDGSMQECALSLTGSRLPAVLSASDWGRGMKLYLAGHTGHL